jgi:hypothetical protein
VGHAEVRGADSARGCRGAGDGGGLNHEAHDEYEDHEEIYFSSCTSTGFVTFVVAFV